VIASSPAALDLSGAVAGLVRSLRAGGWPTALLVAVVVFLAWRLAAQRAAVSSLRRELHGTRVRDGYVAEALAPLAEGFPVEIGKAGTTTVFLGQPVDYVHFDPDDGIVFIEIKSGRASLSPLQRRLRDRVESGEVRWETMRVETATSDVSRARRG